MNQDFAKNGMFVSKPIFDRRSCNKLTSSITATFPLDTTIFLTEDEFWNKPDWRRHAVNPKDANNYLDKVSFSEIENNVGLDQKLTAIAGEGYKILSRRAQRLFPRAKLPRWIWDRVKNDGLANLNFYVREEYRGISHILYYDFHQDIISYNENHKMMSVCIYMDDVSGREDSPLIFLPGSHKFGVTHYPHRLCRVVDNPESWIYSDDSGNSMTIDQVAVSAKAGSGIFFHSLLLHGSQDSLSPSPRIVLRLLIGRAPDFTGKCVLDTAQEFVTGPKEIKNRRLDIAQDGSQIPQGNLLNSY